MKVVEDTPIHSVSEMQLKESSFSGMSFVAIFVGNYPSEGIK